MSVFEILGEITGLILILILILIAMGWVVTKITKKDQGKISAGSLIFKGFGAIVLGIGIMAAIIGVVVIYDLLVAGELGILNIIIAIILPTIFLLCGYHLIKG